ncbi:MAG TPA: DUF2461 domain-containing protein [Streptosporangiaceae bacterium]|nr:DUF2461 domain-containing protein [Streptosporangiaceae bacterium]
MAFTGWPAEALDFYDGLAADNTKTYWTANRPVYEEKVLGPMAELVEELAADFGETKIFRPYRDVRFSKDKTPYKTHIGAMVGTGYVQLSAHGLAAGAGMYVMAPDQLDRYRQAVASDQAGPALEQVIAAIEQAGVGVSGHDTLKSAPRGYPVDHPRIGLLRCKGLVAWQEWPAGAWLGTTAARDRVVAFLRTTRPLSEWLADRVGPSLVAERAR